MRLKTIFSKKPTVKFSCASQAIVDTYPIVRAASIEKKWLKESTQAKKCPSINVLLRSGWVQTAWQDIAIKTNSDDFEWHSPIDQREMHPHISFQETVSWHSDEYHEIVGDDTVISKIVKIQSPWMCRVPEGYSLLQLDWEFGDAKPYKAVTGIYRPAKEVNQLTVQLKVKKDAEFIIKAGQPLCHYMLIDNKQADFIVEASSQEDLSSYDRYYLSIRNKIKGLI